MTCYIFAGGGTGGHLYPGLAVASELVRIEPDAKIVFACSSRAIDRKILDPLPYAVVPQSVQPIPGSIGRILPFVRSYISSARQAHDMIANLKPAAVLGLGGFAAGPLVVKAAKRNVGCGFLNPDAVPGKANRLLARHSQVIFTQFESTAACFPQSLRAKVRCIGCPIRPGFASASREEANAFFGLDGARRTLLVFGGSLLAESLSEAIELLADDIGQLDGNAQSPSAVQAWQILHITGSKRADEIERRLTQANVPVRTLNYCDRMDLAYAAADLVLGRGGAGTIAELAASGTASIIMPYPHHKDQQQRLNAAQLVNAGASLICDDSKDPKTNAQSLRSIMLPVMRDAATLKRMKSAAATAGKPNAAKEVAAWMATRQ